MNSIKPASYTTEMMSSLQSDQTGLQCPRGYKTGKITRKKNKEPITNDMGRGGIARIMLGCK